VLINGVPGSGKSTLAQMYVDEHPRALALDIDTVRGMLGCWLDHSSEAGLIARRLAVAMDRVQLSAGRDVVVPHFTTIDGPPNAGVRIGRSSLTNFWT
jgi:predicted kinase